MSFLLSINDVFRSVLFLLERVITSLFFGDVEDPSNAINNFPLLLPFVAIGVAFIVVKFGIKLVKSFAFGF